MANEINPSCLVGGDDKDLVARPYPVRYFYSDIIARDRLFDLLVVDFHRADFIIKIGRMADVFNRIAHLEFAGNDLDRGNARFREKFHHFAHLDFSNGLSSLLISTGTLCRLY